MHERSHVKVKVAPKSTSHLSPTLHTLSLFYLREQNLHACTRMQKLRDSGNPPLTLLCSI